MPGTLGETASTRRGNIEPAFEVGPPGVGPVSGIDSGDFFEPAAPLDDTAPTAEPGIERGES